MAIGDITQVTAIGKQGEAEFNVSMHYRTTSSIGPKQLELGGLVDAFLEVLIYKQLTNDALDFMPVTTEFTKLRLRDVDDDTVGLDFLIPSGDGQGKLGGSEPLPRQLATLTQKRTEKIGKSFRGRNYWPFLTEGLIDSNDIDPPTVVDILDWVVTTQGIVSANLLNAFVLVIYSPTLGTSETVTTFGVEGQLKTQRRRTS